MSRVRTVSPPWLFGPLPDLLFGCGLLYTCAFVAFLVAGPELREMQPAAFAPLVILLLGTPHYGATLLRVYERRRDRRSYVVFSLWATLLVIGLFLAGLWSPVVGSFVATLYLTWSPWHYTGQNYGLAVMFVRRGGVDLPADVKRSLYLSFLLSFAFAFLRMHSTGAEMNDIPVGYESDGIDFVPLGIPEPLGSGLSLIVGFAYLAMLLRVALALRGAPWQTLLPVLLLALSQALWFSLPCGLSLLGITGVPEALDVHWRRTHYFTWIAVGHFLQYLWVTAYYAKRAGDWHGQAPFYGKTFAAGAAAWTLPALAFGPHALGPVPFDLGLALLVAAAVNIHHFILDGAIWKLRGRIAEVLIRSGSDAEAGDRAGGVWMRRAVWAVCVFALGLSLYGYADEQIYRSALARGDLPAARDGADRLARIGRDRASVRLALGRRLLEERRYAEAREQLEKSLALSPSASTRVMLGRSFEGERLYVRAAEIYETALAEGLPPAGELPTLRRAARAWLWADRPKRALPLLERAWERGARDPALREQLEEARGRAGPAHSGS